MIEVEAEHPVVRDQSSAEHLEADPFGGPFDEASADGAVRASRCGDAFATAAVHQCGEHVVEHHPVRDAAAVTAPWVRRGELGAGIDVELGGELDPEGFDETDWRRGTGAPGDRGTSQSHDQLEARASACIDTPVTVISTGCACQLPDALS